MKQHLLFSLSFLCLSSLALAELPALTEEAQTLEPGFADVEFGFLYKNNPRDFGLPPRDRQTDLGLSRFSFGLGRVVELQVTGVAQRIAEQQDGERTHDFGDWEFGTKIWILAEKGRRPNIGFLYSVKLPNGSNEEGTATDETDFNTFLLVDKSFKDKWLVTFNLGMGILGDPFTNAAQNDVLIVGLGATYKISDLSRVTVELGGQTGPRSNDDPRGLLLSYSQKVGKWVYYGALGVGFNDEVEDFRAHIGFRRRFALFNAGPRKRFFNW